MAHVYQDSSIQQLHARSPGAHSGVPLTTSIKEPRPRRLISRMTSCICQEGEGASLTSTILQQYIAIHDHVHVLVTKLIRSFPSEGRTLWLRHHCN
jgi:hypothetical protein